jgi:hypothetical protein
MQKSAKITILRHSPLQGFHGEIQHTDGLGAGRAAGTVSFDSALSASSQAYYRYVSCEIRHFLAWTYLVGFRLPSGRYSVFEIAIEVSDKDAAAQLEQVGESESAISVERKGMDGMTLFTVVMPLVPLLIHGIVRIVQTQINARRHVRVMVDGMEVRGVSEETLLTMLQHRTGEKSKK